MKHCFRLLRLYYSTVKKHSGRFQIDFLPRDYFFSKISFSDNHTPFVFRIILKVGFRLVSRRGFSRGGELSRNAVRCIRLILLRHCFFDNNFLSIFISHFLYLTKIAK